MEDNVYQDNVYCFSRVTLDFYGRQSTRVLLD